GDSHSLLRRLEHGAATDGLGPLYRERGAHQGGSAWRGECPFPTQCRKGLRLRQRPGGEEHGGAVETVSPRVGRSERGVGSHVGPRGEEQPSRLYAVVAIASAAGPWRDRGAAQQLVAVCVRLRQL